MKSSMSLREEGFNTIPGLSITVVIYFAYLRKKIKDWPWYAKFFAFMAVWGSINATIYLGRSVLVS